MNPIERHPEWTAQQAALEPGTGPATPAARDYRRIHAAIAAAPMPVLPDDFASRVLARIEDLAESAGFEHRLLNVLVAIMGIGALVFVGPSLGAMLAPFQGVVDTPWPAMALAAVVAIGAIDRLPRLRHRATD